MQHIRKTKQGNSALYQIIDKARVDFGPFEEALQTLNLY